MKKRTSKRKPKMGQGVVIGNLIILASSVVMATVVLFWIMSFTGSAETTYSTAIFQSNAQVSEQVSVDDVYFDSGPPKSITVYVRNFGDDPLKVVQVYVDGIAYTTTETTIVARTYGGVAVQYTGWTSGETYVISVATERGNQYEKSFRAP